MKMVYMFAGESVLVGSLVSDPICFTTLTPHDELSSGTRNSDDAFYTVLSNTDLIECLLRDS